MAPKTRGASSSGAGSKRKKPVQRRAREPSPDSESSATRSASPPPSSQAVDLLAGRVIATGRKVDFELFHSEGLILGRQLIEIGWEKFCSLDCPSYPALIKDFYRNLARGDNGLISTVKNVRINVTVDILARLLSLPTSGPSTFNPEDRSPALSRLLNRNFEGFEEILANQLPLELRLLHNICSRILFPKTGRFDYVSERDIFVMDAVTSGKPINLPCMILWYIADCGSKKKACLPYGMVLTLLFRSQGVIISDSEPRRELRHTDYYTLATVQRMGFVKKNGRWERKNATEDRANPAAPGPSTTHDSPVPSPSIPAIPSPPLMAPSSSSAGFNDTQLAQLKSLLDAQKESLERSFESKIEELKEDFNSKVLNLKENLYALEEKLGTTSAPLLEDLKKIFEEIENIGGDSKTYATCNAELQDKLMAACAFVDNRLKEFVKTQSEGMRKILDHCQIITRRL